MKRTLLALAAMLLTVSCAQNPATGGSMLTLVTKQQELAIGQASAEQELKLFGLYKPESRLTKYVTNLCEKVYATTEMAADPLQCIFLDSSTYNAWATPGYINVYRGILPYMTSEAELVAVIAHESGHINARHIAQHASKQVLFGALVTGAAIAVAAKTENADAANLAYGVGGMAATAAVMAYGRGAEHEADGLGQRYMERAGYDKREAVNMVRGMQFYQAYENQIAAAFNEGKIPTEPLLGKLYSSHPPTPDRLDAVLKTAQGQPDGSVKLPAGITPATPKADPQGRKRFHDVLNGTPYGPQRRFGVAGRGYIAFPTKQRFVWKLPDGFITTYADGTKPDQVGTWAGAHAQTNIKFTLDLYKYQEGMNPGIALQQLFPGFEDGVQRLTIGGETAYTGTLKERFGSKRLRVVSMALPRAESLGVLVFVYPNEQVRDAEDAAIMRVVQQSRFLTESQADRVQQLEIQAFTAAAGDSISARAAKLPAGALREEWFRALNNLEPGQKLIPGTIYKTIIDPNLGLL